MCGIGCGCCSLVWNTAEDAAAGCGDVEEREEDDEEEDGGGVEKRLQEVVGARRQHPAWWR